jgi:PAS domain S-box-containing protein
VTPGGGGDGDGLRERRHFAALVEALRDGLVELDADQRVVAVNQRFLDMTGFSREEVVGTLPPHPYWPRERAGEYVEGVGNAFVQVAGEHNLTLVRKDGTALPVVAWVSPVTDPDGAPVGVLGLVRDLTEAQRVEARYRGLVSQSADLIVVLDAGGRFTFVSPAVRAVLGYEPVISARPGASVGDVLGFVHPDDVAAVRGLLARIADAPPSEVSARAEVRVRHADGSWRVLEVVARDLLADPSIEGYVFNARDVTERKTMERALRESEERFRSTVASMLDGLVVYSAVRDEGGRIVDLMTEYANDAVSLHGGYPAETQIGRRLTELFPGSGMPEVMDRYRRVIETGEPVAFETAYGDDAIEGLYEIQVTKLGDGCAVSFREVSEQRKAAAVRAQLERERLQDQLHRAQRLESLGRLAAGVAHDLANSLAAIRNFASVVANGLGPDHPLVADVDQVLAIAAQAADLTEDVLHFGGPATGEGERVEPDALVEEVVDVVQRSFEDLRLERGPERTARVVVAPRHQVEQVLVNLLLNACDASTPGGTITVRVLDLGGGLDSDLGPRVGFEVADSGTGMTPDVVARATEPFFTTKAPGYGTGLGLAAVRGIVDALGGSLRIDSAPGRGTSVLVALPAVEPSRLER